MTLYLRTRDKTLCCGCNACVQKCPNNALSMRPDDEGFLYPVIDNDLCTRCASCNKVCPIEQNHDFTGTGHPDIYAAYAKDHTIRADSSSGGIFSVLAHYAFMKSGIVFGVSFGNDIYAQHVKVDNSASLIPLRFSKYVQSDTKATFTEAGELLNQGKYVYYTGTPCQIAGLKTFLGKEHANLLTSDLVCHGVPSPLILREYVKYLEEKHKGTLLSISFRKPNGWGLCDTHTIMRRNGGKETHMLDYRYSPYLYPYLSGFINRPICYQCPYATIRRQGDITLADYWEVKKFHSDIDTENGVSLLLVNTRKGQNVVKDIAEKMVTISSTIENAQAYNENLYHATARPHQRDIVYVELNKSGFKKLVKTVLRPDNYKILLTKTLIKKIIRTVMRAVGIYRFKKLKNTNHPK